MYLRWTDIQTHPCFYFSRLLYIKIFNPSLPMYSLTHLQPTLNAKQTV